MFALVYIYINRPASNLGYVFTIQIYQHCLIYRGAKICGLGNVFIAHHFGRIWLRYWMQLHYISIFFKKDLAMQSNTCTCSFKITQTNFTLVLQLQFDIVGFLLTNPKSQYIFQTWSIYDIWHGNFCIPSVFETGFWGIGIGLMPIAFVAKHGYLLVI